MQIPCGVVEKKAVLQLLQIMARGSSVGVDSILCQMCCFFTFHCLQQKAQPNKLCIAEMQTYMTELFGDINNLQ